MKWSEPFIVSAIARQTLASKCVVLVNNCVWTGYECDVLGVTMDLRLIDVEVKISRADLKADAKKDKWWRRPSHAEKVAAGHVPQGADWWDIREPRDWPPKVWKHYYALPREIWKPELLDSLPSANSGVLLLSEQRSASTPIAVSVERRAKPNKDAKPITASQALDIARLANLRMWDAYKTVETLVAEQRAAKEAQTA